MAKIKRKKKVRRKPLKPWFKTLSGKHNWGFVPISFEGIISLAVLVFVNVLAGNYFNLKVLSGDGWLRFGVVFFLSFFIFIMISKRRTKVVNDKKK